VSSITPLDIVSQAQHDHSTPSHQHDRPRIGPKKIWNGLLEQLLFITQHLGGSIGLQCTKESILGDKVHGRVQPGSNSGPEWLLSDTEEAELVPFVIQCSVIGYVETRIGLENRCINEWLVGEVLYTES